MTFHPKKNRATSAARLAVLLFVLPLTMLPAFGDANGASQETRPDKAERLAALRVQTQTIRRSAEVDFNAELAACRKRLLVNDCIARSKQRRLERIEVARRLEAEESAIAREIKRAEIAERRARKAQLRASRLPPELLSSSTIGLDGPGQ